MTHYASTAFTEEQLPTHPRWEKLGVPGERKGTYDLRRYPLCREYLGNGAVSGYTIWLDELKGKSKWGGKHWRERAANRYRYLFYPDALNGGSWLFLLGSICEMLFYFLLFFLPITMAGLLIFTSRHTPPPLFLEPFMYYWLIRWITLMSMVVKQD